MRLLVFVVNAFVLEGVDKRLWHIATVAKHNARNATMASYPNKDAEQDEDEKGNTYDVVGNGHTHKTGVVDAVKKDGDEEGE